MNFNTPISPGVSAFVARMRVRTEQSHGAPCPASPAPEALAWRVSPDSGRLESRRLSATPIDTEQPPGHHEPRG